MRRCGRQTIGPSPFAPATFARLAAAALVLAFAGRAAAQERPGSLYLQGGVAAVRQAGAAGGEPQIYIAAPGGTAVGWSVAGGVFAARCLSVEVEWSETGRFSAREPGRYGMTYNEERRDRALGLLFRLHLRPGRRVDIEPLAGIGAIWHDRWSQTETYRPHLPPNQALSVAPRVRFPTLQSTAVLGGVDVRVGGRHVALVPSLPFRAWKRGDDIVAYYPAGSPNRAAGAGLSARVEF